MNDDYKNMEVAEVQSDDQKKLKTLSNDGCKATYHILMPNNVNGKLKKDVAKMVASLYLVSTRTVWRVWNFGHNQSTVM